MKIRTTLEIRMVWPPCL